MSKAAIVLLSVVIGLLAIQIIDRSRETAQLQEAHAAAKQAAAASDRLAAELKGLREEFARRPAGEVARSGSAPLAVADPFRDGKPRLGDNFLKPYDRSHLHPEWYGGTMSIFSSTPKGFNPIVENSTDASDAQSLVNDSLCSRHPATPDLWSESIATSCVISDDWKTYTFKLRPGIRWQHPVQAKEPGLGWLDQDVPLTAHDFAFYIEMVKNPEVECTQLRAYYDDLDRVEVPDDLTLVLRWKKKVFTSMSFSMGLSPLPRHIYARNRDGSPMPPAQVGTAFNKHWFDDIGGIVGVGQYILAANESDRRVLFKRDPGFWGAGLHFDAIEWIADVKLPDPQLVAFKNAQVHLHALTPPQYRAEILDHGERRFAARDDKDPKAGRKGELGWERVRSHVYQYLGWNLRRPLFSDRRVRQALAHAMPKQRIIDEVFFGLGRPQIGPIHLDNPYFNKVLSDFAFDLAKARNLFAEAGWTDSDGDGWLDKVVDGKRTPFRFVLKYGANNPVVDSMLLIYRDELRKLGVDLEPKPYEWKELLRVYEEKDFDAMMGAWRLGDFEPDFWQLWHSSTADEPRTSNHCGFRNKRVDELADALRATFEPGERRTIIYEVQAIIQEEQPYLFFRSGEGIFTWQNKPGPGTVQPNRWLVGVTEGLDAYHPLLSRQTGAWLPWRFQQP
jgi:peptide/nickel transport system substrate-binding protein